MSNKEESNITECVPQDAKKLLDNVLNQLGTIKDVPKTAQGVEITKQIPIQVQKLIKHMPVLEEVVALKRCTTLTTEKQVKVFLAELAGSLNEALDVVKVAKALATK